MRPAIRFASIGLALAALAYAAAPSATAADAVDPVADAKAFKKYFTDKFPKVKLEDFVNGPYSMDEDLHRQWQEKEQFPPYEFSLELGKEMFPSRSRTAKSWGLLPNKGIGIRQNYPISTRRKARSLPSSWR
jgi:sulfur-oxidizing protein SoxA